MANTESTKPENEDLEKLSEEELDRIAGGTSAQTDQLIEVLESIRVFEPDQVVTLRTLNRELNKKGIIAVHRENGENSYNLKGKDCTHEEVIAYLKSL